MRKLVVLAAGAALLSVLVLLPAVAVKARQEDKSEVSGSDLVTVTNFPKVQEVQGAISVQNIPRHGELVKRESVIVPPVRRSETNALIQGGTVETEGFTEAILSLQGEFKDSLFGAGTIGALLVPDEDPIVRAMLDGKRIQFPLEVAAQVVAGDSPFFNSAQARVPLGFGRYRVFFYNTGNKGAEVNLYVYLVN